MRTVVAILVFLTGPVVLTACSKQTAGAGSGGSGRASSGAFAPHADYAAGMAPWSAAIADVNHDGKADVLTADKGTGTVSVLPGTGTGTLGTAVPASVGSAVFSLAVGDVNGDGIPDVVTGDLAPNVSVLIGNGDGTFKQHVDYVAGTSGAWSPSDVALADLNRDGALDIVYALADNNLVTVLLNNGDGTFKAYTPVFNLSGYVPASVTTADVNRDGIPDIVVAYYLGNKVSVALGNGDGTFQLAKSYPDAGAPYSVATGDVNHDGYPDIVTLNFASEVAVLLNAGDGTFKAAVTHPAGAQPAGLIAPRAVAVADVDNDGNPDIVTANSGGDDVSVLLGNGDGTFQAETTYPAGPAGSQPHGVAVGYLDGNLKPDIVTANAGTNDVSVLLGR